MVFMYPTEMAGHTRTLMIWNPWNIISLQKQTKKQRIHPESQVAGIEIEEVVYTANMD